MTGRQQYPALRGHGFREAVRRMPAGTPHHRTWSCECGERLTTSATHTLHEARAMHGRHKNRLRQ